MSILILEVDILNPDYSETFLPFSVDIRECATIIFSVDILPDIKTKFADRPQRPTGVIEWNQ